MAYRQDWADFIRRNAPTYRVDPQAALAVARVEGLSGAVGDNGTSFGPFQLHEGGALPQGRGRAWAESPAGILYALRQMGGVAGGLTGNAAVDAIVRRFERPADPTGEIRRALANYKDTGGAIPIQQPNAGSIAAPRPRTNPNVSAPGKAAFSPSSNPGLAPRQLLAAAMAANAQFANTGHIDQSSVIQALQSPPVAPQQQFQTAPAPASAPVPSPVRPVKLPPGNSAGARGLAEAFYDPLGQWDNGRFSSQGIGGHTDHVHLSITNPQSMLQAIAHAQQMGLAVRENPYVDKVDPVHVPDSFHYRDFPGTYSGKKLGEAIDASGDPKLMAAYFRWALANLR